MARITDLRSKLTSPTGLVISGAIVVSVLLMFLVFRPGGLLDWLAGREVESKSDFTLPSDIEQPQEAAVPAELSDEKNAEFLAANGKKEGVKTTASGLQYRVLKAGTGKQPGARSRVTVHYAGALINGKQFDSSAGGDPITFGLWQVIPGWTEGLQLMREGEKAELVIPQDIGYGERGSPGAIPPRQTLVFQVELIKVD